MRLSSRDVILSVSEGSGWGASRRFLRRLYRIPAEREEELAALLWAQGTLGLRQLEETAGEQIWEAYFDLAEVLPQTPAHLEQVGEEVVEPTDWTAVWRRQARPIPLGERFLVDPREPSESGQAVEPAEFEAIAGAERRHLLRLPARTAFGTGSHESTRLAWALAEELDLSGLRVLDVGTGSGILALAARVSGAESVIGCDLDPAAALLAEQNARLNEASASFFVGSVEALGPSAEFDLALVNVVPSEIREDLDRLVSCVRPAGQLVFSGILAEQVCEVLATLADHQLVECARQKEGEWIALRMARRQQ